MYPVVVGGHSNHIHSFHSQSEPLDRAHGGGASGSHPWGRIGSNGRLRKGERDSRCSQSPEPPPLTPKRSGPIMIVITLGDPPTGPVD